MLNSGAVRRERKAADRRKADRRPVPLTETGLETRNVINPKRMTDDRRN
jgi:hypothetical protein